MSEAACAAACSLHVNATAYDFVTSCEGKGGRCRVFGLGGQMDTAEGGACDDGWVREQGESGDVVGASDQQQSICVAKTK
jgi:hypothetical protein